ncbi:MAG TPA: hypothetical protein VHB73_00600 [Alphaproteobacteria bacterium]|nr:hypothetical protein [Alphaproteobacteria bacterium]
MRKSTALPLLSIALLAAFAAMPAQAAGNAVPGRTTAGYHGQTTARVNTVRNSVLTTNTIRNGVPITTTTQVIRNTGVNNNVYNNGYRPNGGYYSNNSGYNNTATYINITPRNNGINTTYAGYDIAANIYNNSRMPFHNGYNGGGLSPYNFFGDPENYHGAPYQNFRGYNEGRY